MKKIVLVLCVVSAGFTLQGSQVLENYTITQNNDYWERMLVNSLRDATNQEDRNNVWKMIHKAQDNGREYHRTMKFALPIRMLSEPKTLGYLTLAGLGLFAAWHATSLIKEVANHYIMLPPLAQKTSIRSWTGTVKDFFVYEDKTVPPRSEVILSDDLKGYTEVLTQSIINAAQNDTFFSHYLFYGPPGTGKTMLAMAMAQEAGLEYIYFSAGDLKQYSLEEGIKQVRHLFEYAKAYPKKLMIIMDEADDIFTTRGSASERALTLLNLILTYTGTEQSDFMVIALTNRTEVFDSAGLSRFGEKIEIGAPGLQERKRMFAQYAQKYLIDSHTINRDNRTTYQWFFSPKPKERLPLNVADEVFTDEVFNELAKRSEGLVGRDIAYIMQRVQNAAYAHNTRTITKDVLYAALEVKKQQEQKIKQIFKNSRNNTVAPS